MKLHIGIDLDGVLRDTYRYFIDHWNTLFYAKKRGWKKEFQPPYELLPFEKWTKWNLTELHNGENPLEGPGVLLFRQAMRKAPAIAKAVGAIKVLKGAGHHVYIVTACDPTNNYENMIWLQGKGLSNVHYINLQEKHRLLFDVMIDDDPRHFDKYWQLDLEGADAIFPKCFIINQPWTDHELNQLEIGAMRTAPNFMNPWKSKNIQRVNSLWDVVVDMMRQE